MLFGLLINETVVNLRILESANTNNRKMLEENYYLLNEYEVKTIIFQNST